MRFSTFFRIQLGISNLTPLLRILIYSGLQISIQLPPTVKKFVMLSANTQRAFRPMVDILSIMMVVALNMALLRQSCTYTGHWTRIVSFYKSIEFRPTGNSVIRSADPENPTIEPNMK